MLLALDTATRQTSIALFDQSQIIAELNWHSRNSQTTELMPRLQQILSWHNLSPTAIEAIAVTLGPGSFTGLRVALSAAKGMALALDIPLVGVPTLDVMAYPHLGRPQPVCAVVQAGRGRVAWATYWPSSPNTERPKALSDLVATAVGPWQVWRTAYHLSSVGELLQSVSEPTYFTGELTPALRQELGAELGVLAILAAPTAAIRRAGPLAELAWQRLQRGEADDPDSLSPLYLKEP